MKKPVLKILAMTLVLSAPVFQAYAEKAPVIAAAAEGASIRQSMKTYYVTAHVLNIRSGPGTSYSVIGSMTRGMEIKVISISGKKGDRWAKLRFQGLTAYASMKHLSKK